MWDGPSGGSKVGDWSGLSAGADWGGACLATAFGDCRRTVDLGTLAPLLLGTFPALSWGRWRPLSHKGTISAVPCLARGPRRQKEATPCEKKPDAAPPRWDGVQHNLHESAIGDS